MSTPKKSLIKLDPLSIKHASYTSLKDVLPFSAAVNSPSASHPRHVSIRNRLVKQAAWAYLQPMSTSPRGPSGPLFFHRLRNRFSSCSSSRNNNNNNNVNPLAKCLSFIYHHIFPSLTRTLRRILHAIPCLLPVIQE